jgi:hypothetical protein
VSLHLLLDMSLKILKVSRHLASLIHQLFLHAYSCFNLPTQLRLKLVPQCHAKRLLFMDLRRVLRDAGRMFTECILQFRQFHVVITERLHNLFSKQRIATL